VSRSVSWSRRGFLSARGLGASAGGLLAEVLPDCPGTASTTPETTLAHWHLARRAMACEFSVMLPPTVPDVLTAGESALDVIQELEDLLTVHCGDSAAAYLNQHAGDRPVRVDGRLFHLLERAAELSCQTNGAFDVSTGSLVRAWGFLNGTKRVPSDAEIRVALAKSGMQHIQRDPTELTVHYAVPGLEVNFASMGKGYAIDRAIRRLVDEFEIECALMQGGLSSIYGLGSSTRDGRGWLVGIQNPFAPDCFVATVRLRNRALGTSGAANQWFETNGQRWGHVLDPRTGWSVGGPDGRAELASASAIADDAATADALATAFFVMGLDKTADFCQDHPEIAALLVLNPEHDDRASAPPRVVTFNLPSEDVNLRPGDESSGG